MNGAERGRRGTRGLAEVEFAGVCQSLVLIIIPAKQSDTADP